MKILFSSNASWSVHNFRTNLLKSLQKDGHEIFVVAKEDAYSKKLQKNGFNFKNINVSNNSKNPIKDLILIRDYIKVYKKLKPDIILHNAIKPNIYGTIAANYLNIPTINNISGLGTIFIKKSITTKLAKLLYKISQQKAAIVFFQNKTDKSLFISKNLVSKEKVRLIPGSGVNIDLFHPKLNTNQNNKRFEFLFIARLIKDKGIIEYLEAAKILKTKHKDKVTFSILGSFYNANETAITKSDLNKWINDGIINYIGETDTVESEIAHADCVVLPSYREGLSKVLIEASAMEKLIITTNVPGCKDVVIDGYNGYLCEVKSTIDLANKMKKMFLLNEAKKKEMGLNARKRAVEVFDEKRIIEIYKREIYKIVEN